jgi:hypothetical protein
MPDDPPRRIADSLTEAIPGSMVYIDERGHVLQPRARGRRMIRYLASVGLRVTITTGFYWAVGGQGGLLFGGALALLLLRGFPAYRKVERATRLVAAEHFDEAEPLLRGVAASRFVSQEIRGRADRLLATVVAAHGDHPQALALEMSALRRMARHRHLRSVRRGLEYARVVTLVNLDRVPEAAALFTALPRVLEGDYLRVQRAFAELYLAFAEGRQQFDREELRAQADLALAMPQGRGWLTVIAWAYKQMGDGASAARLLAVAETRASPARIRAFYPKLADWAERR